MKLSIIYLRVCVIFVIVTLFTGAPVFAASPKAPALAPHRIVYWTNVERITENPLSSFLKRNTLLDKIAAARLEDMFTRQYFEHNAPTGEAPNDVAKKLGYHYIYFAENIALGIYPNDKALVQAWMDSPRHRDNIINNQFTEIGVAARLGIYKNRRTWIAVQVFGKPQSDCPLPDAKTKTTIHTLTHEYRNSNNEALVLYNSLKNASPQTLAEVIAHNQSVAKYNALVSTLYTRETELKKLTGEYNAAVEKYNSCLIQ